MSLQIETAQNVGVDYEIASIGDRILAQLIDYAVYFVWFMGVAGILAFASSGRSGDATALITMGGMFLPVMLYPLLCEYFLNGQTVGKMALKIRVIMLDGSKPTLSAYLLRWLLVVIDVSLFSGLVAILTIVINGKGQRVGDIAAGTAVIKTQPSIALEHLMHSGLTADYKPRYEGAKTLSDKDIYTLKKVISSGNAALQEAAVFKIEKLIGVNSLDVPVDFLQTVVNDYQYYVTTESEGQ